MVESPICVSMRRVCRVHSIQETFRSRQTLVGVSEMWHSKHKGRSSRRKSGLCRAESVAAAQNREDAQDLDVEPDDRHHDAEGAKPAVLAGGAVTHTLLDLVEVHDQRVGGHEDHQDANDETERDAGDRGAVEAEGLTLGQDTGPHEDEVEHRECEVAEHRDHDDLGHLGAGAHLATGEECEGDTDDGEGREGRLHDHAGPDDLEVGRDGADEETLESCVGPDERRAHLLARGERDDHGEHETAESAHDPRRHVGLAAGVDVARGRPDPAGDGGDEQNREQPYGLPDRVLDRHPVGLDGACGRCGVHALQLRVGGGIHARVGSGGGGRGRRGVLTLRRTRVGGDVARILLLERRIVECEVAHGWPHS